MASSRGLVVKAEYSWPRGSMDQCLEQKLWKTLTWHCCMCCNPANGRVEFEEWSAYKIQLHGIEWIVSLLADWDQSPTTTKKKKLYRSEPPLSPILNLTNISEFFLCPFFHTLTLTEIPSVYTFIPTIWYCESEIIYALVNKITFTKVLINLSRLLGEIEITYAKSKITLGQTNKNQKIDEDMLLTFVLFFGKFLRYTFDIVILLEVGDSFSLIIRWGFIFCSFVNE